MSAFHTCFESPALAPDCRRRAEGRRITAERRTVRERDSDDSLKRQSDPPLDTTGTSDD